MGWIETDTSDNDRWEYLNNLGIRVKLSWFDESKGDVRTGYHYRIGQDSLTGILPSMPVEEAKAHVLKALRRRMQDMMRFM